MTFSMQWPLDLPDTPLSRSDRQTCLTHLQLSVTFMMQWLLDLPYTPSACCDPYTDMRISSYEPSSHCSFSKLYKFCSYEPSVRFFVVQVLQLLNRLKPFSTWHLFLFQQQFNIHIIHQVENLYCHVWYLWVFKDLNPLSLYHLPEWLIG